MRRLTVFAAGLLAAGLALSGPAAAQVSLATDPAKAEGGAYVLDKSHAKIVWNVSHLGFSRYYGEFTDFDAEVALDPAAPEKSTLKVTIATAGIATHDDKLDAHLKAPDFFDVEKHPTATFVSTGIEKTGENTGKITGDLTLLGVTKPITLDAVFNGAGANPFSKAYTAGFSATGTLKRSEFGMDTYAPAIGDEVELVISAEFVKKP